MEAMDQRLAVFTNWGFFGPLGIAVAMTGFAYSHLWLGLGGFALLIIGFCAHLIVNRIYATNFTNGEVALALVMFGLSLLSFIGSWIFDGRFSETNKLIGLIGFSSLVLGLVVYMFIRFGVRESYEMVHRVREYRREKV